MAWHVRDRYPAGEGSGLEATGVHEIGCRGAAWGRAGEGSMHACMPADIGIGISRCIGAPADALACGTVLLSLAYSYRI